MYAHGTRGVILLSYCICRVAGPTSSRLRVISTSLSRWLDFHRQKIARLNYCINIKESGLKSNINI